MYGMHMIRITECTVLYTCMYVYVGYICTVCMCMYVCMQYECMYLYTVPSAGSGKYIIYSDMAPENKTDTVHDSDDRHVYIHIYLDIHTLQIHISIDRCMECMYIHHGLYISMGQCPVPPSAPDDM